MEFVKMNVLTKRETEIFNLFILGFDNHEISQRLRISNDMTNSCVSNIYKKLKEKMHKNTNKQKCISI